MKSRTPRPPRIFGPVPSRRLGFSLGVDIVPFKTCTLDCLYCQLGRAGRATTARRAYAPSADVLRQLKAALRRAGRVDWITFSGSGEPTLHSGLGEMIRAVKRMTRIPVAVITNGTLLADPRVRRGLREADLVLPDLDAGSAAVFRRINRPDPSLRFPAVVEGIRRFVREFQGRVWLEVVLVRGVNDAPDELKRIGALAAKIRPDRIQLNTVVRPPAYSEARPLAPPEMRGARRIIAAEAGEIPVDIVAGFRGARAGGRNAGIEGEILASLARRPGTARDLAAGLGIREDTLAPLLARLVGDGAVAASSFGGTRYYRRADAEGQTPGPDGAGAGFSARARRGRGPRRGRGRRRGRRGGSSRRA